MVMSKPTRWAWIISLIAVTGASLVLIFLLAFATDNRSLYEKYYVQLLVVNVIVAGLLILVILLAALRLTARVIRGKFGSRLLLKLAAIFALVGVVPGVLIYTVSYQFVSRSIENWFDVRVEGALGAGLNVGRSALDTLKRDLAKQARLYADRMADNPDLSQTLALEHLREDLSLDSVVLVDANAQVIASAGVDINQWRRPPAARFPAARSRSVSTYIEGLDDDSNAGASPSGTARIIALAWVPARGFDLQRTDQYLLLVQDLPYELTHNAVAVQQAFSEYQQRALGREGLRKMYVGTLTLALVLAVFGAFLVAALLGQQLAQPLLLLAEGVSEVAHGDLRPKPIFTSRDELGGLTRSFAAMTQQLADARSDAQRSVRALESARGYLQTILDNLSAGVIVFDTHHRIETVNPGATRILRLPLQAYRGRVLAEVPDLEDFSRSVNERFELTEAGPESGERDHWQESYELPLSGHQEPLNLLVRGAHLPGGPRLLVFDDITEIASSQRAQAWSEVARRLAHEIKNPLTPIQLSAERLLHKLGAKLDAADQQMLQRSVNTIVDQVQGMKQLVNEFRDYARLPNARLLPLDLNGLISDVLVLYATALEQGRLRVELDPALPLIMGDAMLLRQVVHNLVQNALDAIADLPTATACVQTSLRRDDDGHPRRVRLSISDNGPGFSEKVLKRAFEPYFTTKSKGTGLGLAVVKKIADEHEAVVRLSNLQDDPNIAPAGTPPATGARVSLSFTKLVFHTDDAPTAAPPPKARAVAPSSNP